MVVSTNESSSLSQVGIATGCTKLIDTITLLRHVISRGRKTFVKIDLGSKIDFSKEEKQYIYDFEISTA